MSSPSLNVQSQLKQLVANEPLAPQQATQLFDAIMAGEVAPTQIAAALTAIAMRPAGPTADELTAAAQAMRHHARPIAVTSHDPIDTCGTGGDHSGTFNISTTAAIVAAACGVKVVKHGNRSVTSRSGSSQVLEALGVELNLSDALLQASLDEANICFAFAPAHHPAMRHVAPVRADLGFRTIFNLLGPLTNPAGARRQVIGVFDPDLTELIAEVLRRLGAVRALVVHGHGMDEITTTGPTRLTQLIDQTITTETITPDQLGLTTASLSDLQVDSVEASAEQIRSILDGQAGPAREIVLANTAAALWVAGHVDQLADGVTMAAEAIDRKAAQATLAQLVEISHRTNTP